MSSGPATSGAPLGVILAGGGSRRYGSPKALAEVGGRRIVDRVAESLRRVTPDLVLSANEPALFRDLALPTHPDDRPDLGPLAGIYTTLLRAREAGRPGILAVACDMPFPCVPLLERLRDSAFGTAPAPSTPDATDAATTDATDAAHATLPDVVVPESRGRRGLEPLFAAYRTSCLPAIEAALAEGDRRVVGFHGRVRVRRIPLAEVESLCDAERAFLNVNTGAERDRAEALAAREEPGR